MPMLLRCPRRHLHNAALPQSEYLRQAPRSPRTPMPALPWDVAELRRTRPDLADACDWLEADGAVFRDSRAPSKFVTGRANHPFPLNMYYFAERPLAADARKLLRKLHISDPVANSPARLAERFSIEPVRVLAILKLGVLGRDLVANGGTLQKKYAKGMETMMPTIVLKAKIQDLPKLLSGDLKPRHQLYASPVANVAPSHAPYLAAFDENKVFAQDDALRVLCDKAGKSYDTQGETDMPRPPRSGLKLVKDARDNAREFVVDLDAKIKQEGAHSRVQRNADAELREQIDWNYHLNERYFERELLLRPRRLVHSDSKMQKQGK